MKAFMYDTVKKNLKEELYQYTPKDPAHKYFIDNIIVNPFDPTIFMVQICEMGARIFIIKKK